MKKDRRIKTSEQDWKLFACIIGVLIGGGVMLYGVRGDKSVAFILSAIAMEIAVGIFACTSIRCPDCGLRWVWYAVSKTDMNQWLTWLVSFERCPGCELTEEIKENVGEEKNREKK